MTNRETVGVDLGGTKILVGVVGEDREVLYEDQERSAGQSQDQLLETIEREVREALERARTRRGHARGPEPARASEGKRLLSRCRTDGERAQ